MSANYLQLKLLGNNNVIELLRHFVGHDLVNVLEADYQRIIQIGMK